MRITADREFSYELGGAESGILMPLGISMQVLRRLKEKFPRRMNNIGETDNWVDTVNSMDCFPDMEDTILEAVYDVMEAKNPSFAMHWYCDSKAGYMVVVTLTTYAATLSALESFQESELKRLK